MKPCNNPECSVSTGIHEGLTFGHGGLDHNGFWSEPCKLCARDHERRHPEDGECWPFSDSDLEAIKRAMKKTSQASKDYW